MTNLCPSGDAEGALSAIQKIYQDTKSGLEAYINLDFGTDWGTAAARSFANRQYFQGALQEINGMAEAAIDLGVAYIGAGIVGGIFTGIENTIATRSLTAGYIAAKSENSKTVGNLKNTVYNLVDKLKTSNINDKKYRSLSVIGPRSNYREYAKSIGANYLNVTDEEWTKEKNYEYLKEIVTRKDDVKFSCDYDPSRLDPKSTLAWEIQFLEDAGYQYIGNNTWSIK